MQDVDLGSDRRRLEDDDVRRRDQELIERQRRLAQVEAERRLIAQAIGVDDREIVLTLQSVGYKADTIVLLELAPPVQVAWADGSVCKPERELLLTIAAREHVTQDSPAHAQLLMWLDRSPSAHLYDSSLHALGATLASLQPDVRDSLRRKLIGDCATIAGASGGYFGWGRHVSKEERQVIDRLVSELF